MSQRPKVPVMAPGTTGQLALASHHEAAPAKFPEDLSGSECQIELEHLR
jgi:hypothetical protein